MKGMEKRMGPPRQLTRCKSTLNAVEMQSMKIGVILSTMLKMPNTQRAVVSHQREVMINVEKFLQTLTKRYKVNTMKILRVFINK